MLEKSEENPLNDDRKDTWSCCPSGHSCLDSIKERFQTDKNSKSNLEIKRNEKGIKLSSTTSKLLWMLLSVGSLAVLMSGVVQNTNAMFHSRASIEIITFRAAEKFPEAPTPVSPGPSEAQDKDKDKYEDKNKNKDKQQEKNSLEDSKGKDTETGHNLGNSNDDPQEKDNTNKKADQAEKPIDDVQKEAGILPSDSQIMLSNGLDTGNEGNKGAEN